MWLESQEYLLVVMIEQWLGEWGRCVLALTVRRGTRRLDVTSSSGAKEGMDGRVGLLL